MMTIALLPTLLLTTATAALDYAPRVVPYVEIRTQEKSEAEKREAEALEKAGLPDPPDDPDYTEKYKVFLDQLDDLGRVSESLSEKKPEPNANDALYLVDLLYQDMAHSEINRRWQMFAVDEIRATASRPGLDDEVVDVLRQGLLEYSAAGGGLADPMTEMGLANALAIMGGPAHPEVNQRVSELLKHAEQHAEQLQDDFYTTVVAEDKQRIESVFGHKYASGVETQKAFNEADRALRIVSLSDGLSATEIGRAALLATVDFGDTTVNEDMIARLLIAYRLRLENRKGLTRPVIAAIDKRLLWLAEKKTRKLTSKRHWTLWPKAVGAIPRQTISHDLHGFLRKSERAKEDHSLAKAAADAQGCLRRQ